jgi:hypothetical protein
MMSINNEIWSPFRLSNNIQSTAESIISSFHLGVTTNRVVRTIKWNCNNHTGTVLNVDGSYITGRAGYGGLLRNSAGHTSPVSLAISPTLTTSFWLNSLLFTKDCILPSTKA